ncbi:hypothetical protein VNI00_013731 [Paramarasmius palmivorus]|uniref:Uncharacterized protein n=1 Tax=Paramarasmius palmivorus TaxID=297713 RepID=A0AAW0BUW7_9AGAR
MHNNGPPGFRAWSLFLAHLVQIPEFCGVKALTVTETRLNTESDFRDLVPLHNLERLALDVAFEEGDDGNLGAQAPNIDHWIPGNLKQLDVSGQEESHRSRILSYFAKCRTLQELRVPLIWQETEDSIQGFLVTNTAVRGSLLQCCTFRLPEPPPIQVRLRYHWGHCYVTQIITWRNLVCTTQAREITVEGPISSMSDFFWWTYRMAPGNNSVSRSSKVTKIVVTDGERVAKSSQWASLDRVWTNHWLFRSLKEIQVEFTSLDPSQIGRLLSSVDGTMTPTPESTRSAMMACQGDGSGLLQAAFPLCRERNLLKVSKQGIR